MGSALRSRPWLLWLLLLGLVVMSLGVVAVVRARGDRGGHGAALAKYGFRQRQEKAKEGGESEGGSRHGAEEREVGESEEQAEREHGEEGDKEGEKRDPHEAAATILGREGGEGDRHGANTPWGEQVGATAAYRAATSTIAASTAGARSSVCRHRRRGRRSRPAGRSARRAPRPGALDAGSARSRRTSPASRRSSSTRDAGGPATQESGPRDRDRDRPGLRVRRLPACGSPRRAAASGAPTTRSPTQRRSGSPPPADLPTTAFGSLLFRRRQRRRSTRARASRTARATRRPAWACSSRPTSALVVAGARQRRRWRPTARSGRSRSIRATRTRSTSARRSPVTARRRSNGGRRTPPDAPPLGVYRSTNGGATLHAASRISPTRRSPDPTPPATGVDLFQGGITKLALDPNDPDAALRRRASATALWRPTRRRDPTWDAGLPHGEPERLHRPDSSSATRSAIAPSSTSSTSARRRASISATPRTTGRSTATTPRRCRRRARTRRHRGDHSARPDGRRYDNDRRAGRSSPATTNGTTRASRSTTTARTASAATTSFVVQPARAPAEAPSGARRLDELRRARSAYGRPAAALERPRGDPLDERAATARDHDMAGHDRGARRLRATPGTSTGRHPSRRARGGLLRRRRRWRSSAPTAASSASTSDRPGDRVRLVREARATSTTRRPGAGAARAGRPTRTARCCCRRSRTTISAAQRRAATRSSSSRCRSTRRNPASDLLGGTQDNGTWSFTGLAAPWFESVGGDGGQSGFDADDGDGPLPQLLRRDAGGELPRQRPDDVAGDLRPAPGHRRGAVVLHAVHRRPSDAAAALFTGLEHVWRTDDNGGDEQR